MNARELVWLGNYVACLHLAIGVVRAGLMGREAACPGLTVSSETNCNRATLPCFPTAGGLQREADEVAMIVSCSGTGVEENGLEWY
jgi:hypothetical protein